MSMTLRTIVCLGALAALTSATEPVRAQVPPNQPPPAPVGDLSDESASPPASPATTGDPSTPSPSPATTADPAEPADAPSPSSATPVAPTPPPTSTSMGWVPPPSYYASEPKESKETWYGWQTLIVMGVSTPLVAAFGVGLVGLAFGGPIVHWTHGNVGKGFGALGLNVGLTTVGGVVGYAATCSSGCGGDFGGLAALVGFLVGGGVGLLTANIIDAAALSYETVDPREEYEARHRRPRRLMVIPQVDLSPQKLHVGAAFVF